MNSVGNEIDVLVVGAGTVGLAIALLHPRKSEDVMTRHPETAPAHLTLREFVDEYALTRRHHAFPVVENEQLLGIIPV